MIKCDRCGFDIPDNNRFCTNCDYHMLMNNPEVYKKEVKKSN